MAKFKACCPGCGEVEFSKEHIWIESPPKNQYPEGYIFQCPNCEKLIGRTAVEDVIELLASVEVQCLSVGGVISATYGALTEAEVANYCTVLNNSAPQGTLDPSVNLDKLWSELREPTITRSTSQTEKPQA